MDVSMDMSKYILMGTSICVSIDTSMDTSMDMSADMCMNVGINTYIYIYIYIYTHGNWVCVEDAGIKQYIDICI